MAARISTQNRATMEKSSLLLKLKACAGQRVTLFERLDWKTPIDAHTREPITVITERYLGVLRFCRWSQPGHNQKLVHLISEIRVERSHLMFCTDCHKIDITTGYCSWVEIHPYKKNNRIQFASQTPDIQICLLVQQTGTIIADDLYLCIKLVSMATTYL